MSPPSPTDVLVVSDVRLYRDGILDVLDGGLELRATASDGTLAAVLAAVERSRPDVALVDVATAGWWEAVRLIRLACPAVRVILLTVPGGDGPAAGPAEVPGAGRITRDGSRDDLLSAIAAAVCRRDTTARTAAELVDARLTVRELEILRLLEQGFSNKEIAARLVIGVPTVKSHVHNILRKLGASRRGQAAARARVGA